MKKSLTIIILFFAFATLYGQRTSPEYDSLTLHYYNIGHWDSLLIVGDEALKNDIDYFYLRSRMGYAAFIKEHFRKSIKHFEKAYQMNSYDDFVKYYLYLAYKNAGMISEANYFGNKLSEAAKENLQYNLPIISDFYLEVGLGLPDSKANQIPQKETYLVAKTSNKNMHYSTFGFNHNFSKNISLFHAYSNYKMNDLDVYGNQFIKKEVPIEMSINQYYISPSFRLFKGATIHPFAHFSFISTQYTFPSPIINPIDQNHSFKFGIIDTSIFDLAYGANFFNNTRFGGISAGLSINQFGGLGVFQQNIGFLWYPLKTNKLYFKTDIQHLLRRRSASKSQLNFEQIAGFSITENLWSELFWVHGNITGSNMNNGYLLWVSLILWGTNII
ncbi:MAG: hypothetical protein PHY85_02550 [Bacteroidales bacterium]|nr:hypothetical protein [Bacteroidales bacterium]